MKDVLSVGVPKSGGADTGMGKMAASRDSRVWPRPCSHGRCWAPCMCTVEQTVTGMCLKSAVTKLVYFK